MSLATAPVADQLLGSTTPRVAPPVPAGRDRLFALTAEDLGIELFPWQRLAGRYLMARTKDRWRYREVCIVVGRQNGKTELLLPRIVAGLEHGERILHTAHRRTLPRQVFLRVARSLVPAEVLTIRYANGQETIEMANGGSYQIVAAQRGARGLSTDLVIYDEVREFEDFDVIAATTPTQTASADAQTIYLSNAGSDASVVLNDLKRRSEAENGADYAYLEWSAGLERSLDDRAGWAEANPALGYLPSLLRTLEQDYRSMPTPDFETEHLCRWVASMQPKLVSDAAWMACRAVLEEQPTHAAIAFNMDGGGTRASAVMSWQMTDGRIALVELAEAHGQPIDLPRFAADLKKLIGSHAAKRVAFASWTDKDLARYIPRATALDGKEFASASEHFARLVLSGRLAWDGAGHVTDDLSWTARKPHDSGAWQAVPTTPERSVTAVLAAIRAVWLASAPRTVPRIG